MKSHFNSQSFHMVDIILNTFHESFHVDSGFSTPFRTVMGATPRPRETSCKRVGNARTHGDSDMSSISVIMTR
jgi:hypothetical protein